MSPSSRRAWIEITPEGSGDKPDPRRPPRGGRGLKFQRLAVWASSLGRPPRGGRGLKSTRSPRRVPLPSSPSSRRAWIEILKRLAERLDNQSPSSRRAWIEIEKQPGQARNHISRPPRGGRGLKYWWPCQLAVRRNGRPPRGGRGLKSSRAIWQPCSRRRPPRGGRGLKFGALARVVRAELSPSSRRAWIEICSSPHFISWISVALLAEGVD